MVNNLVVQQFTTGKIDTGLFVQIEVFNYVYALARLEKTFQIFNIMIGRVISIIYSSKLRGSYIQHSQKTRNLFLNELNHIIANKSKLYFQPRSGELSLWVELSGPHSNMASLFGESQDPRSSKSNYSVLWVRCE